MTGHRVLADEAAVLAQIGVVVDELVKNAPSGTSLGVVSPLAEGADRLVARDVLARTGAVLELALPLASDDYIEDFASTESRREFVDLRDQAKLVTLVPSAGREDAYAEVGQYVVAHCDVLIAVWDGQKAHGWGGTGAVAKSAEEMGVPTYQISADGAEADWTEWSDRERLGHLDEGVDRFNAESLSTAAVEARTAALRDEWLTAGNQAHLSPAELKRYVDWVGPPMARADLLAARYQRWYRHAGSTLFAGSFFAVALAAYQALFQSDQLRLVWVEAAAMAFVLVVLVAAWNLKLHKRWLGYRSLAEQFRAGLFRAASDMGEASRQPGSATKDQSERWVPRLFDELWMVRPRDPLPEAKLGAFVRHAWLDHQIKYNRDVARRNSVREKSLRYTVAVLFFATFVVAVVHAAKLREDEHHWLELASILLPAAGAALHGLRSQRDYARNAERAEQLLAGLDHLQARLRPDASKEEVKAVVGEASRLMLAENREWFGLMRHHDLEIQV